MKCMEEENVGVKDYDSFGSKATNQVGQEQIHGLLFGDKLSWQAIIYDLINTEQLNPWDVDICLLSQKYLEKVRELEEANFFVSSKVLLASSLLLRIKSEILLHQDLKDLDDVLYGREKDKKYVQERIELEDDVPELVPRTPLPRGKKVSLQELMVALGKAIKTETRRIKRVVVDRQREIDTMGFLPVKKIDIGEQINSVYTKLKELFKGQEDKLAFSSFSGESFDERVAHFIPLLHLDNQHKVLLEQDEHFGEIWVWLKELHNKKHAALLEVWRKEVEESMDERGN
jgi:segregation and condensation protein A